MTMNKPSKLLLLLLILATPVAFAADEPVKKEEAPAAAAPAYKPKSLQINRAELDALLTKPNEILIIDLRRPDELTTIGGFPVYLSIQPEQLEKSLAFIPKDRAIITVSNHGGRSGKSADLLAEKGFKVAGYVGAQYYEEQGGKLTKIAVPKPAVNNAATPAPAAAVSTPAPASAPANAVAAPAPASAPVPANAVAPAPAPKPAF
jgi:rhodanese-related sulfurtransferase